MKPSDAFWHTASEIEKIKLLRDCYVVANRNIAEEEGFADSVKAKLTQMEDSIARFEKVTFLKCGNFQRRFFIGDNAAVERYSWNVDVTFEEVLSAFRLQVRWVAVWIGKRGQRKTNCWGVDKETGRICLSLKVELKFKFSLSSDPPTASGRRSSRLGRARRRKWNTTACSAKKVQLFTSLGKHFRLLYLPPPLFLLSILLLIVRKTVVTSEPKFIFFLADFWKFREIADIISRDEKYKADSYLYVVDKNQRAHFEGLKAKKE